MNHRVFQLDAEGKERLVQKAIILIYPHLEKLRDYSPAIKEAVSQGPDGLTAEGLWDNLSALRTAQIRGPAGENCLGCGKKDCVAWVALHCGGCDFKYWVEQTELEELWCFRCASRHFDNYWREELEKIGVREVESLEQVARLYDAREQLILAFFRKELQRTEDRLRKQKRSSILAARCRKTVAIARHSIIGPFKRDHNQELERYQQQLNRSQGKGKGKGKRR